MTKKIIPMFEDDNEALVACKECGSDKWHLLCDTRTDPPRFTQIWCATDTCNTGCEIELVEVPEEGGD